MYPELWLIGTCFFMFGAVFGSFGNVLIFRVPNQQTLGGRSHCPNCDTQLNFIDLIPLFGFLIRNGRCKYCNTVISKQYPLVELASALLFPLAWYIAGFNLIPGIILSFALWLLLLIAVIDWQIQGIPDLLSIPFVILSIAYGILLNGIDPLSLGIGVAFFGIQWLVSHGTWVGSGDIVLIIGISAIVSPWPLIVFCILTAYIIGAIVAALLLATGIKSRKDHVAFGPFLAISTVVTCLWGAYILEHVYGITV